MKWRLSGASGALILIAAACSVLGSTECTEIGCSNEVGFTLEGRGLDGSSGHFDVEICFDDTCQETRWSFGETLKTPPQNPNLSVEGIGPDIHASLYLPADEYDEETTHEVSFVAKDADGEVARITRTVQLERSQPNGPGCDPICWVAEIALPPERAQQG